MREGDQSNRTKIAFIGRPNVGKSSLCNRLLDLDRLIVSDVPGTTRETVELDLDYQAQGQKNPWCFRLFDTAGLKRSKRIDSSLDYFSAVRTKHAIEEVDVVFLVLDAKEGVTKQDKVLAGHVLESGKLFRYWSTSGIWLWKAFERILFLVMRMKQIFGRII